MSISFIITYHNEPSDTLLECLQSIMALELREDEYEMIVIDDGSSTHPMEDTRLQAIPVKYIRQTNQGISCARNTGISHASMQYIQFVDADDALMTTAYSKVVDLLREEHPDAVMFDFTCEKPAPLTYKRRPATDGTTYMARHNINGAVWSSVIKKEICHNLSFTPGTTYGEDEEFTARMMLRTKSFIRVFIKAYYYRQHPHSATHQLDWASIEKRFDDNIGVIKRLRTLSLTLDKPKKAALGRRTDQLTLDIIYNAARLTHDASYVEQLIRNLRKEGLFPVPLKAYTAKYVLLHVMTCGRRSRKMLCRILSSKA
ncbi:MAG: glycosyltransferase family 2 protein [Prevotella sp.]|nr:glycosyltransferase family 2 protein [Prevotella sp.]